MPKYRKKPIVIEAVQWFPEKKIDGVYVIGLEGYIETLEGEMIVRPGDWIITGVKGEKYPCNPDIFEMIYEWLEE